MIRTARLRKLPRRRPAAEALEGRQLLTAALFQAPTTIAQGTIIQVAVGDLNGDGKPDLVLVEGGKASGLYVDLNEGNGTFGAPVKVADSAAAASYVITFSPLPANLVALGDFNGDGKLDVAVAGNDHGRTVSVLPGLGDGTFGAPITSAVGTSQPDASTQTLIYAVGDFRNDGKLDIVLDGAVALGNGDGTFGRATKLPGFTLTAFSAVVGDFNGDGKLDIAQQGELISGGFPTDTTSYPGILYGNGDGTFKAPVHTNAPSIVANLDNQGGLDGVSLTGQGYVLLNQNGTFPTAQPIPLAGPAPGTLPSPLAGAFGNFNGDPAPDLVLGRGTSSTSTSEISVFANPGNGVLQPLTDLPTSGPAPISLASADFNGDGRDDVLALTPAGTDGGRPFGPFTLSLFLNTGAHLTPPAFVSGALDPASDTGASHTDAITADTTPAFLGQAAPGASIAIFAHRIGSAGTNRVATATAGADGSWRATTSALPAGAYTITATATLGGSSASATLLGGSKPLQIVTAPPVVTSVVLDPLGGRLIITFAGAAPGGLDRSILKELTAIALSPGFGRNPGRAVTAATLSAPTGPSEAQTLVLTLDGGRRLGPGPYTLVIAGSRIHDIAGNPLDGAFRGSFPSGAGRAGSNFTARFLVGFGRATRPIPLPGR